MAKTQQIYFQKARFPYLRVVSGIVKKDITDVVEHAHIENWEEILALICSYAKGPAFAQLCRLLGTRIEQELPRDSSLATPALICFMASGDATKAVSLIVNQQLKSAPSRTSFEYSQWLENLVEKTRVLEQISGYVAPQQAAPVQETVPDISSKFLEYSYLMANCGCLDIAVRYFNSLSDSFQQQDSEHVVAQFGDRLGKATKALNIPMRSIPEPFQQVNVQAEAQSSVEPQQHRMEPSQASLASSAHAQFGAPPMRQSQFGQLNPQQFSQPPMAAATRPPMPSMPPMAPLSMTSSMSSGAPSAIQGPQPWSRPPIPTPGTMTPPMPNLASSFSHPPPPQPHQPSSSIGSNFGMMQQPSIPAVPQMPPPMVPPPLPMTSSFPTSQTSSPTSQFPPTTGAIPPLAPQRTSLSAISPPVQGPYHAPPPSSTHPSTIPSTGAAASMHSLTNQYPSQMPSGMAMSPSVPSLPPPTVSSHPPPIMSPPPSLMANPHIPQPPSATSPPSIKSMLPQPPVPMASTSPSSEHPTSRRVVGPYNDPPMVAPRAPPAIVASERPPMMQPTMPAAPLATPVRSPEPSSVASSSAPSKTSRNS